MADLRDARTLLASLRDALHALESQCGPTQPGVNEIATLAARVRDGVDTLCALRGREAEYTGVDMLYDRANDLQQAMDALSSLVADAREDLAMLEAALEADDAEDRSL
jgi:hypothetical protein